MKFAKELEEELVPEWRAKYFSYKTGKKKIKAITRAVQTAQRSPRTPLRRTPTPRFPIKDSFQRIQSNHDLTASNEQGPTPPSRQQSDTFAATSFNGSTRPTPPLAIPQQAHEQHPLNENGLAPNERGHFARYGSIIGSPPSPPLSRPATLNLPGPAISTASDDGLISRSQSQDNNASPSTFVVGSAPAEGTAFEVGKTKHPSRTRAALAPRRHSTQPSFKSPHPSQRSTDQPLIKRLFSGKHPKSSKAQRLPDIPLEALQEIDAKKSEFFLFLDTELDKIESFYKSKEEESTLRLDELKKQLHALRDQREAIERETVRLREERKKQQQQNNDDDGANRHHKHLSNNTIPAQLRNMDMLYHPIKTAKQVHFGKTPAPNNLVTPPDKRREPYQDHVRRPESPQVSYQYAKRKLRTALQEYYRGLELLKAYALSNRTAFRKINKKYDKAVQSRNPMSYMNEKVNDAWFVQSTVVDNHITAVEDLYARYFEKGSHKLAVGKLRKKSQKAGAFDRSVFRNGLTLAAALIFGLEGLVYGANIFYSAEGVNPILAERTSFLLQFYAAYFLLVFLVLFFCLDCYIFTRAKVNYAFVFEFDTRHNLDWRQLCELPCLFSLLLGLTVWLNFSLVGGSVMYIWWPVVLVGLTVLIMFAPLPILYYKSRKWFIYSCWRLLGAGLYPVEFRDFFLGDMFCSQTYSFGGIELFFCIYASSWRNPSQCNSSNSMLLGFLTTLPGIMRLLQCFRRYYDTRNVFPHLVNGGKYSFTILQYASLSVFRINEGTSTRAFFITCGTINAIYCSIWDLVMDWSLMDPEAEYPFLRRQLAYKSYYYYYLAMIIDPILRFNWIFYAIPFFAQEIQHSALLGFLVSFSEVIRRGIWTIFRVENEHCTNVGRFRASRDVELPYQLESQETAALDYTRKKTKARKARKRKDDAESEEDEGAEDDFEGVEDLDRRKSGAPETMMPESSDPESYITPALASGADIERVGTRESAVSSLRRRQQEAVTPRTTPAQSIRARFGSILHGAHAQDFERRKKDDDVNDPEDGSDSDSVADGDVSDDEDEGERRTPYNARTSGPRGDKGGSTVGLSSGEAAYYAGGDGDGDGGEEEREEEEEQDERERRRENEEATSRQNRLDVQSVRNLLRRARGDGG